MLCSCYVILRTDADNAHKKLIVPVSINPALIHPVTSTFTQSYKNSESIFAIQSYDWILIQSLD
jgi:hypothetical protein